MYDKLLVATKVKKTIEYIEKVFDNCPIKERIVKEKIVKAGNINERTSSAYPQKKKSVGMGKENSVPCP